MTEGVPPRSAAELEQASKGGWTGQGNHVDLAAGQGALNMPINGLNRHGLVHANRRDLGSGALQRYLYLVARKVAQWQEYRATAHTGRDQRSGQGPCACLGWDAIG